LSIFFSDDTNPAAINTFFRSSQYYLDLELSANMKRGLSAVILLHLEGFVVS